MKTINWEPKTEAGWLALLLLLSTLTPAYRTAIGMTDLQYQALVKAYNMLKQEMDNVTKAEQSLNELIEYKTSLLEGPVTVSMVAVPLAPVYETGAAICPAGIKTMVRAVRMALFPNCTPAQLSYLTFVKGDENFVPADYHADGEAEASIGNIAIHSKVKNVAMKNLYARVTGTNLWIFIRTFSGAHYDYHRVPTTPNTPESVDMIVYGVIDNVQIGHASPIFTVLYQPQQTPTV